MLLAELAATPAQPVSVVQVAAHVVGQAAQGGVEHGADELGGCDTINALTAPAHHETGAASRCYGRHGDTLDGTTSTVYLVSIVGPWVTWRDLGAAPTYYGEKIVSGTVVTGHEPWFSATGEGERCVVEWRRAAASSPFPGRAVRAVLAHADRFEIGDRMYLVYVEPSDAAWTDTPTVAGVHDETSLETLQQRPEDEIVLAARRFLALPHVSAWWCTEFKARTGFVQCRDGRVPRPRACNVAFLDNTVRMRWEVAVWDLFRGAWVPGCEHASFERDVGGRSLAMLLDCATRLVVLPVE